MQCIYTYIRETNHVPEEYNVATIPSLLFMVPTSLAPALALMYFYLSTFRSMCAVPNMARSLFILVYYNVWLVLGDGPISLYLLVPPRLVSTDFGTCSYSVLHLIVPLFHCICWSVAVHSLYHVFLYTVLLPVLGMLIWCGLLSHQIGGRACICHLTLCSVFLLHSTSLLLLLLLLLYLFRKQMFRSSGCCGFSLDRYFPNFRPWCFQTMFIELRAQLYGFTASCLNTILSAWIIDWTHGVYDSSWKILKHVANF
jgi:hypothetical protein